MTDLVTFGEAMLRLSPPGHERLEGARTFDVHVGGAEANAAIAAERLGADPVWLSKLPDTPLGHRVVSELHGYGIRPDVVWSDEGRQGLYFLEQAGQPRGSKALYDRENAAVTTASFDELPTEHLDDATAFFTSGITPALSNKLAETSANLMSAAKKAGTKTVFDVNYRSKLWDSDRARAMLTRLFPAVDILITAARDAKTVLDLEGDPRSIAHSLASKWEFDTVVITRGASGALAIHDGVIHEQAAFEAETVDPVGSGDAFSGAFIAARMDGKNIHDSLELATAAAALKRTIPGDVPTFTEDEVNAVIENADDNRRISR